MRRRLCCSQEKSFLRREIKKVNRNAAKLWWTNGYKNWDDSQFKHHLRVSRETFELILQRIEIYIVKEPTNMVPFPIEPHRQLGHNFIPMCSWVHIFNSSRPSWSVDVTCWASICVRFERARPKSFYEIRKNAQHRGRMETRSNWLHWKLWLPLCWCIGWVSRLR